MIHYSRIRNVTYLPAGQKADGGAGAGLLLNINPDT